MQSSFFPNSGLTGLRKQAQLGVTLRNLDHALWVWQHICVILTLCGQRQEDCSKSEASLGYIVS